jgi:hypothetical protein
LAYDRLSDTYGTKEEIDAIKAERKKKNKEDHAAGIVKVNEPARKPVSTTAGQKQRMVELKEQLLSEGNAKRVLAKLLSIANDDEHPGQMTAVKLCVDRILPVSMFEDKKDGARTAINITFGKAKSSGDTIEVVSDDE